MFAAASSVVAPTVTGVSMTTESTGLIGDSNRTDATPFAEVSPHLYNADLAPTKREGRRWGAYNIFTLWANDVHSLGNYSFAIGLFALGLGGWQIPNEETAARRSNPGWDAEKIECSSNAKEF